MRKNMVDVVMKVKFSINKYSLVWVMEDWPSFIIIDQYFGYRGEGHNFSFTDVELHIVSSAPTIFRVIVTLQ
jgi:hypothetical protein